jgi:hypothetical protein
VCAKRWILRGRGRPWRIDRFTRNGWPDRPGHAGSGQARGEEGKEREAELSLDYVLGPARAPGRAETATFEGEHRMAIHGDLPIELCANGDVPRRRTRYQVNENGLQPGPRCHPSI